jgi:hypothetical protein
MRILETDLQRQVMALLRASPRIVWARRLNSGKIKSRRGGWVKLGDVGDPDIVGMLDGGRFFAIELKRPDAPASDHAKRREKQREVLRTIDDGGGRVVFASTIEEIQKGLGI